MSSVFKIPYTLILSVLSRDVVDHLEEVFEGIVELYRAPYLLNKCTTQTYRLESRYLSNNVSRTSTNISGGWQVVGNKEEEKCKTYQIYKVFPQT